MGTLRFSLFGYPQIWRDTRDIAVDRGKSLALAAYLAVESGAEGQAGAKSTRLGIRGDVLTALFWPDASQQQAGATLRQSLIDLAHAADEAFIIHEGPTVRFNPQSGVWVDVNQFEIQYESWKAGAPGPGNGRHPLAQTADLYRADFLAGFTLRDLPAFDKWQSATKDLLHLHMAQILETLTNHYQRNGAWNEALQVARRRVELDRVDESAQRALLQVLIQSGQQSAALRQYQQFRDLLAVELGLEPAPETARLMEQARRFTLTGARAQVVPTPTLPSGTVTFLFSDIEGSTRLWENYPEAMAGAFKRQEAIMRAAMAAYGGYVYKMIGDAFQVAFATAAAALKAAVDAQQRLHAEAWGEIGRLRIRMALHSAGNVEERGDDYVGPALNRLGRMMSAGYGGQILLSQTTAALLQDHLPDDVTLIDLGEQQLKDIARPERIYEAHAPGILANFPPLKTVDFAPLNLPVMETPFLGRQEELGQIEELLSRPECRLITLFGVGGSGKTRLALQAASRTRSFEHQACFVSLTAARALDELILALIQGLRMKLHIPPGGSLTRTVAREQLFRYLAKKRLLLVLDNFEQLTECADFAADLLRAAPKIKLIVTSRERLNLPGEWVIEVKGLAYPPNPVNPQAAEYPAVQLFLSSAQRVSGVRLAAEAYPAIVRICQLLEGVPLGIEMAASWVKLLTCGEIVAEIEKDVDFLRAAWRGAPERHRTLRAVFDHSWQLLGERERDGLIRLGIFQGSFSRQTAAEVTGASILALASLVDKSFLRRAPDNRYEIHPVLSPYVVEKLTSDAGLLSEVQAAHARFFSDWLYIRSEELKGPAQLAALYALRLERQNIKTCLKWLVDQQMYSFLERALPGLVLFSVMNDQGIFSQSVDEILIPLGENLSASGSLPEIQALVLATLRYYAALRGRCAAAEVYENRCREILPSLPASRLKAYTLVLNCFMFPAASFDVILNYCQESIRLFDDLHDSWGVAMGYLLLGDHYNYNRKETELAMNAYLTSSQAFTVQENEWGLSLCYFGLMDLTERMGDLFESHQYGCLAEKLFRKLENNERVLYVNTKLAEHALKFGDLEDARCFYNTNLVLAEKSGFSDLQRKYQERLDQLNAMG